MTVALSQEMKDARLIERLQMENTRLRGLNRKYARNQGMSFESVVDDLKDFLLEDKNRVVSFTPSAELPPIRPADAGHSEYATLILSDWHIGETVRPEESNGINVFNSMIAANRVWECFQTFMSITRRHQKMYKIEGIWLPILGDMISGSIHDELILTNDLLDLPSTVLAARLLIMGIKELKTMGLPIHIDCTVGNHPRLLLKMPTKRQAHLSYDWLIYTMIADAFEGDPQVEIKIHTGVFGFRQIYGHRFIVEHGYGTSAGHEDDLMSHLRDIFDNPTYRKSVGLVGTSYDMVLIGHTHQPRQLAHCMVNGSLVGSNELGMTWHLPPVGAYQQMFGTSKKHTLTWHYALELTSNISELAENPMSVYTKQFMKENGR